MRPLLNPALRTVWRDAATLQIGLDQERAVILHGLDADDARVVESLDGTRDVGGVLARAAAGGLAADRAAALLRLLDDADVLVDAATDARPLGALTGADRERLAPDLDSLSLAVGGPDGGLVALDRRRRSAVLVHGAGRVGAAVAGLLAAAGVGYVVVEDAGTARPADVGPAGTPNGGVGARRDAAACEAVGRVAGSTRHVLPAGRSRPDVAVLAPVAAPDPAAADDLLRAGVPHLLAVVRETTGVVGPLVLPGRSACLRCTDLRRADRDPAWPRVAAQLAAGGPSARTPCDVVLATLVAAQAALEVLALLDVGAIDDPGDPDDRRTTRVPVLPPTVDGTLETSVPAGRTRRRSWAPHPACGCRWPQGR